MRLLIPIPEVVLHSLSRRDDAKIWTRAIDQLVCVDRDILIFSLGLTYAAILKPVVGEKIFAAFLAEKLVVQESTINTSMGLS